MSPRAPDPRIRTKLIETAARLLAEEGPDALTTRRLAAEVGTSTMAVYTYFDGMEELRRAVRVEGFERLARFLDAIEPNEDAVTYVSALGGAYFVNALSNPHIYKQMFLDPPIEEKPEVGIQTLDRVVNAVAKAMEAGRFTQNDPLHVAKQCWSMTHGIVTITMAGLLTIDESIELLMDMGVNLFVGLGDEQASARRSTKTARDLLWQSMPLPANVRASESVTPAP